MKKQIITKKFLAVVLTFAMMATILVPMKQAAAETTSAEEPGATNISFDTARDLTFNSSIAEETSSSDKKRYYKFSLSDASVLTIGVTRNAHCDFYVTIYDKSRTAVYQSDNDWDYGFSKTVYLTGGDYYLGIETAYSYSMLVSCDSLYESFVETQDTNNNSANTASDISVGSQYKGVLACNDEKDYYKFTLADQSKLTVNITNSAEDTMKYTIYDSFLNSSYTNTISENKKAEETVTLAAGTYYLAIEKKNSDANGSYNFTLSSVKLVEPPKATTKPTQQNDITSTTTTTSSHTSVKEKKVKVTSTKNKSSRAITVKWEKISGVTGYQVQFSTKKNFKKITASKYLSSSKSSMRCSGLKKKKTYYVRVRAYIISNGTKMYGSWSAKKKVKIKK